MLKNLKEIVRAIAYLIPYSPLRGIVWQVIDKSGATILDVGCGKGDFMHTVALHRKKFHAVGVDGCLSYLKEAQRRGMYESCVLGDVRYLPFKEKAFDVILCIEVIEHLSKDEGLRLIQGLEQLAKKQVVFSTPVGNPKEGGSKDGNILQEHKSSWSPHEFRQLGYQVRGQFGPHFRHRFRIIYYISFVLPTVLLVWYKPEIASHMVVFKNS